MTVRANTDGTTDARTAHVPLASSHARADLGDAEFAMRLALRGLQEMGQRVDESVHSPEAHDVIAAELVACTLGQRSRLELQVDRVGRFTHMVSQGVLHLKTSARALMDELAAYHYPVRPEGIEPPTIRV